MKIIRNTADPMKFEDLKIGDVFISEGNGQVYMKTDEVYEYSDKDDYYLNAVKLEDGSMVKFREYDRISVPQSVTLIVEERKE